MSIRNLFESNSYTYIYHRIVDLDLDPGAVQWIWSLGNSQRALIGNDSFRLKLKSATIRSKIIYYLTGGLK